MKKGIQPSTPQAWPRFEDLRQEINRMFDDVGWASWPAFRRSLFAKEPALSDGLTLARTTMPAVDVVETEKAYELAAKLPGMDEKNIEIKMANGILTISGEKLEQKGEKAEPESVDADKIQATVTKGVLAVTLPKKSGAQKPAKKVKVKAA